MSQALERHRAAWRQKPVLRAIYHDYFTRIAAAMRPGRTLEIGGGTGNFKEYAAGVLSSDIQFAPWLDLVADAQCLPIADGSIDNVVMVDVLHHIERPLQALADVVRVLRPGGRLVLLEPGATAVSSLAFTLFHAERCDRNADVFSAAPTCSGTDPYDANQAVPTLIFVDGEAELRRRLPRLRIIERRWLSTLAYPLSGGFQPWCLVPAALVRPLLALDDALAARVGRFWAFRLFVVAEVVESG